MVWINSGIILLILVVIFKYLYGKENMDRIILPLLLWLLGVYFTMPVKFSHNYVSVHRWLYMFFMWASIVGFYLLISEIERLGESGETIKYYGWVRLFVVLIFMASLYIPLPSEEEVFLAYEKEYDEIADDIFEKIDEEEKQLSEQEMVDKYTFMTYPWETKNVRKLEKHFDLETFARIEKLVKNRKLYRIGASHNGVYFYDRRSSGDDWCGIVIFRNYDGEKPEEIDIGYLEKVMRYSLFSKIKENKYYFTGDR